MGTSSEITIDVGGTYTVTATTIGDIGCSTTKSIEVTNSEFAKFNTNDVIISGFSSQENTVEIIIDNLGVGDYEYALDDSSFQDDPYFEQVRPGMRTIRFVTKTVVEYHLLKLEWLVIINISLPTTMA